MCGRFTLRQSAESIATAFEVAAMPRAMPEMPPRYNIAPTQPVLAVRQPSMTVGRQLTHFYWGLIPSWAKDPAIGSRLINARSETAAEKPSFRTALRRRRCLIVADGFYEWQRVNRRKQPYYFQMGDRALFGMAGLWEHWESPDGAVESCTILTTEANELLRPIHDRMPVIVHPADYDLWLDPTLQRPDLLQALMRPYEPEVMQRYAVSLQVNSAKYDAPDCLEPIEL